MRLRVGHQHSQFWPILARFLDYYSLFSVPIVISIVVEPQGAFTCRSSTIAVWVKSGPFLRQLLTVLGVPGVISTIYDPGGAFKCPSSTLTVLANPDPFRGLLLTVLRPKRFP